LVYQLWGNAGDSNIDIMQRSQSKIWRTIKDIGLSYFVRNENIHSDLGIPTVKYYILCMLYTAPK